MRKPYSLAIMVSLLLMGCGSSTENSQHDASPKAAPKLNLSDKEDLLLGGLIADDIEVYIKGGEALFEKILKEKLPSPIYVSSDKLQSDYEGNEVVGDRLYRNKMIFVQGVVLSIDRSIGENYYLKLEGGGNPFINPQAGMADGYTDYLASLNKGDEVALHCSGNGMLMGSAMLNNCEPLNDFVNGKVSEIRSGIINREIIFHGEGKFLTLVAIATEALPDSSKCFEVRSLLKNCMNDFSNILQSYKFTSPQDFDNKIKLASDRIGFNISGEEIISIKSKFDVK